MSLEIRIDEFVDKSNLLRLDNVSTSVNIDSSSQYERYQAFILLRTIAPIFLRIDGQDQRQIDPSVSIVIVRKLESQIQSVVYELVDDDIQFGEEGGSIGNARCRAQCLECSAFGDLSTNVFIRVATLIPFLIAQRACADSCTGENIRGYSCDQDRPI